jgi:DNA repair exonuclease SbcCD nuclease subunit
MGEYLLLSDVHATRHAPSSCTDTYWPDLLDLLRQSVGLAGERGVLGVVWAGDVFHHKAPRRTDHGLMQDLIKVVQAYPCPVWIVPGNHDIQHDRLDSIGVTQPLGVLYQAGARRLEGWADWDEPHEQHPLYGVPWLQDWSEQSIEAALESWRSQVFGPSLVVTHAPIYPPGREPPYECTPASWWATAMPDEPGQSLFYGHVHEPHGTYRVGGLTFCNNGALSRGSLDEYNLARQVGCTLWDSGTGEFEFVPLDAKPAGQVFRLAQRERETAAQEKMTGFLAAVGSTELSVLSIEGVLEHFRTLNLADADLALAEELLMAEMEGSR